MLAVKRIPQLDGLRGLAIGLVVLSHNATALWPSSGFARAVIHLIGMSGVDLFFVLSGFLIGGILLDRRKSESYYKPFYLRRACRILPLYLALLAAFYLSIQIPQFAALRGAQNPIASLYYLTFTQNFAMAALGVSGAAWLTVTWSLAIEEQFYLIAPLAVRKLSKHALIVALLLALAIGLNLRLVLGRDDDFAIYVLTFTRLDGLILGMLCALALMRNKETFWLRRRRWLLPLMPLCVPIAAALLYSQSPLAGFSYTLYALGYAGLLLIVLLWPVGRLACFFQWQPLRSLGVIAYGVYLLNTPCNSVAQKLCGVTPENQFGQRGWLASLLGTSLVVIVARLSWLYFERPLIELGRRAKSTTALHRLDNLRAEHYK